MTDPPAPPQLLVETPPYRVTERRYVLSVLLDEWLGLPFDCRVVDGAHRTTVRRVGGQDGSLIEIPDVFLKPDVVWLSGPSLPRLPFPVVLTPEWSDVDDPLPLLYAIEPGVTEAVRRDGDHMTFTFDLIGALFFLLARYEEHFADANRDEHGRVRALGSVLHQGGWLRWPIADMYAELLRGALDTLWPGSVKPRPPGGVRISHDVDHPTSRARWRGSERFRVLTSDVIRRRDPALAMRRAAAFLPIEATTRLDPLASFTALMETSESLGLRSTFFFLTADTATPWGSVFTLQEPWAVRLLREIAKRGHRVGLHGSYPSSTDAARLAHEWALLETACAGLPSAMLRRAVRQHFLMMTPSLTWRAQAAARLDEDETLGYADEVGYRAGTARSFLAWDLAAGARLPLRVRPLHVMDVSLREYLKVPQVDADRIVADLVHRTHRYGGELSILWHNSSLADARTRRAYRAMLTGSLIA